MKSCNQCGKCCEDYSDGGLVATPAEVEYWKQHHPEIAAYVHQGQIWYEPNTDKSLSRCPWLQESRAKNDRLIYSCRIYKYRPADCRQYPVTISQMRQDRCQMLEPSDLKRPKSAQRQLDKLMAESRVWSIDILETP